MAIISYLPSLVYIEALLYAYILLNLKHSTKQL